MKKERFLVIKEANSWEGETWAFLFKDTEKNRKFFTLSKKHLKEDPTYTFSTMDLTKEEIERLKKSRWTTYMNPYNFLNGNYDFEKGMKTISKDRIKDPFYKGHYEDFKV